MATLIDKAGTGLIAKSETVALHAASGAVRVRGAVALVTDAGAALGSVFVEALAAEGTRKIYVRARDSVRLPEYCVDLVCTGVIVPLDLELDDAASFAAAARMASDVTLLVNTDAVEHAAIVERCRVFEPVLAANAPAAVVSFAAAEELRRAMCARGVHVVALSPEPADPETGTIVAAAFDAIEVAQA